MQQRQAKNLRYHEPYSRILVDPYIPVSDMVSESDFIKALVYVFLSFW
ncbi:hypothetical protein [Mesorhizobium sp. M2A.F.Ca.ET.043.05.1.1]|nr:hypothetical protein [Mesorhizobium sp. M2A.F.Ca.ET.043.05.1.1]